MLEAIRARALDPYAALHLDPLAPTALVTAMYRMLAERARTAPSNADELLARLNAARSMLIDTASRGAYDRARGSGERCATRTYYESLGVAVDADAEVIELAYAIAMRDGAATRGHMNRMHRTLSNPYLRARYDAALAAAQPDAEPSIPAYVPHSAIEWDAATTNVFERRMTLAAPPAAASKRVGAPLTPSAQRASTDIPSATASDDAAATADPEGSRAAWSTAPTRKALLAKLKAAQAETAQVGPIFRRQPAPAIASSRRAPTEPRALPSTTSALGSRPRLPLPAANTAARRPRADAMTARLLELAPSAIAPARSTRPAPPNASGTLPIRWALLTADD